MSGNYNKGVPNQKTRFVGKRWCRVNGVCRVIKFYSQWIVIIHQLVHSRAIWEQRGRNWCFEDRLICNDALYPFTIRDSNETVLIYAFLKIMFQETFEKLTSILHFFWGCGRRGHWYACYPKVVIFRDDDLNSSFSSEFRTFSKVPKIWFLKAPHLRLCRL